MHFAEILCVQHAFSPHFRTKTAAKNAFRSRKTMDKAEKRVENGAVSEEKSLYLHCRVMRRFFVLIGLNF
jgi:hypothetical protein